MLMAEKPPFVQQIVQQNVQQIKRTKRRLQRENAEFRSTISML
jgi:hypothetical protein